MRPAQSRVVRMRKLIPKTLQDVLLEADLDALEYEGLQRQYKVETGVDKSEESEVHLQAALNASTTADKEKEIPAPLATAGDFDYDALYTATFATPSTYIRSSQTVEECTGCQYSLSTQDEDFLADFNEKRPGTSQCSEDDLELVLEVFEETAELQAPFASIDNTIVSLESMRPTVKDRLPLRAQAFAQDVYEYWKRRRQEEGNHSLQPSLKFETHQDNDDTDPYVCFRRREARVQRKTRARDAQSTEKLRRLRKELEDGRRLVQLAVQREQCKTQLLQCDAEIFRKRAEVRSVKVRLSIKGDDEDLINQKPPKRQRTDTTQPARPSSGATLPQLRLLPRTDGRPPEADLPLLSALLLTRENALKAELESKSQQHRKWNINHVDLTREPLSPIRGRGQEPSFRPAVAHTQLLTPPSSVTSETFDAASPAVEKPSEGNETFSVRFFTPPHDSAETRAQPAYRRRIGRNGRLWIDRRGMTAIAKDAAQLTSDRWKYDEDDSDEQPVYEFDPYDARAIRFRSSIPMTPHSTQKARTTDTSRTTGGQSPTDSRMSSTNPATGVPAATAQPSKPA